MTEVQKIDSNVTGLRIAEEVSPGVLPATPVWTPLDPNSYSDFGGELTLRARNPINPSRQRLKGVIVDLDASGGFNHDLTQSDSLQELLQGFMFADLREKSGGLISDVDGANEEFSIPSLGSIAVNSLVFTKNLDDAANNGLHLVTAVTPDVKATGTLTLAANPAPADTITIGGRVYTFRAALTAPAVADEILIGAAAANTVTNIVAAINGTAGAGTIYSVGTEANEDVTAVDGAGDTVDFTAIAAGLAGNAVTTTEAGANTSFGGATLSGGVDAVVQVSGSNLVADASPASDARLVEVGFQFAADDLDVDASGTLPRLTTTTKNLTAFGLIPGERVFVGGDSATQQFAATENNGWKTVRSVDGANSITIGKSAAAMTTEASSGGKTLRLFFGRVLKNEVGSLIKRRTYQLERELGAPDDAAPAATQAEYLTKAVANELVFNSPQADIFTLDMNYIAGDHEQRTAAQGLKAGTRPAASDECDAYNTSSDFSLIKLSVVSDVNESPEPLFAFVTELTLRVNNNVSQNKAVGVLGAFDTTAGTFTVTGEMTAYFADIAAVQAVRNNSDVSFDFVLVKANKAMTVELPLVALGNGRLNVEQDQPITLPLSLDAATARCINAALDYTLLLCFFDYVPDAADTAVA